MSIDLTKLTPSPWVVEPFDPDYGSGVLYAKELGRFIGVMGHDGKHFADAEFIALARNAFDVMMRRWWSPLKSPVEGEGWRVDTNDGEYFFYGKDGDEAMYPCNPAHWPDPFTALIEADKWYRENIEHATKGTP